MNDPVNVSEKPSFLGHLRVVYERSLTMDEHDKRHWNGLETMEWQW